MKILTAMMPILLSVAQAGAVDNPVQWTVTSPHKAVAQGAELTVRLHAAIESGWHLYGLAQEDGGPVPTEISLPADSFLRLGTIRASKPIQLLDPNFNKRVGLYVDHADFSLPLKLMPGTPAGSQHAGIQVRYQCCSGTMCLPPRLVALDFVVPVKAK
jgi:DsbC/DsbD-like thiol-disulfide interchange protein